MKLKQIPDELLKKIKECKSDEDVAKLGFKFFDFLKNCKGYKEFSEKLTVWYKELEDGGVFTIVTFDLGNSYSDFHTHDILIEELKEI